MVNVKGVEEEFQAAIDQISTFEPAIGGGIIKRFGPPAAQAAGSLISRALSGIRLPRELGPGKWIELRAAAQKIAEDILEKWKLSGVGAGARSGQHGKPYLRAAQELKEMLNKHGKGWIKEFREVIEKKIKDFESKGNINEKISGRGGKR